MRVLLVAPPWFAVPPMGYGGIESVVALLADGLVEAGLDVELVACGGSQTRARLRPVYEIPPSALLGDVATELHHVLDAYLDPGDADLIHDHSGIIGAAIGGLSSAVPVVHTLHGPWTDQNRCVYHRLADRVHLVAISHDQARRRPPGLPLAGVVHNGVDLAAYPVVHDKDDFLLFVGRASHDKGPEVAIEVARRARRRLVMAIKVNEAPERAYFRDVIEPAMHGVDVEVIRNATLPQKAEVMGRAACLLFPIRWPEPFGLVMVEAMACGTPVVAYANGAAPEIVAHGRTGFLVTEGDIDGLVTGVAASAALDPADCRARVAGHFSAQQMVARHVALYDRVLRASTDARPRLRQAG